MLIFLGSQNEDSNLKMSNLSCRPLRIYPRFQGPIGPQLTKHNFFKKNYKCSESEYLLRLG